MTTVRLAAFLLGSLLASAVEAQQLDPSLLQKAIVEIQQQRNEAMDRAALAQARAAQLTEELQKVKAELDALKGQPKQ